MISPFNLSVLPRHRCKNMCSCAMKDDFFAKIMHDLNDFGYKIGFSICGGAGAYKPFVFSSEKIDTPEKQRQFVSALRSIFESGDVKLELRFSLLVSPDVNAHYFLHEIMHFYQDMHGLYLTPLQEQNVFPVMLDVRSNIIAILFCEAWAQVEAIRSSWALCNKGDDSAWKGAVASPDWRCLAQYYDGFMQSGMNEKQAAANIFRLWYEQEKQRSFYERQGLKIHKANFAGFRNNVRTGNQDIAKYFRKLEIPMLLARLPKGDIPDYFALIDWEDDIYNKVAAQDVLSCIAEGNRCYEVAENPNIQDIKCGSAPYLWSRLRLMDKGKGLPDFLSHLNN